MPEEEHPDPKRIVEAGYDLIGERYGKMCAAHHEARELREEYRRQFDWRAQAPARRDAQG